MERGFNSVAVASSVVSIGLGVLYWVARIGFPTPLAPIVAAIGVALILINLPVVLRSDNGTWFRSYAFTWLMTLLATATLGRSLVDSGTVSLIPIMILGGVAFLIVFLKWFRQTSIRFALLLIAGSAYFATWTAGVVWGRIYKSPLFFEALIGTGIVHHDGVTLAALGNMLRTYHVATMGLDGIPYMAYHWGSPWLFAQLSNITGQSVLQFYQLGYAVIFIPLFFGSVLAFAVQMSKRDITRDGITWVLFIAATIGIFPITGMDALGVWTSNLTISESYAVAIPVGLMLLASVMIFWRQRGSSVATGNASAGDLAFLAIILGGGLVALGYIKISFMVLGFGAVGYAALRIGAWKRWSLVLIGLWITGLVAVTYQRASLIAHREGVVPFDFLKSFVPRQWWAFFVLAQLFWTVLYIVLRLRQEKARTIGDVIHLVRTRRVLDVEILSVTAIAGILPGFILHIDGGSAFYFSDIQRWIALGFLLTGAATLIPKFEWNRYSGLAKIAIAFVAVPFVVSTLRNSVFWTTRMLKSDVQLRYSLYPSFERASIVPGLRSLPHLTDPAKLRAGLEASDNYQPIQGLIALSKIPLSDKQRSVVFVPQKEKPYWNILKRPNACAFSGFLVPSLSGIAMIDGMPRADCKLSPYYGLSLFQHRTHPQTAAEEFDLTVCEKAASKGFDRVIRLDFDDQGRMSQRVIPCSAT